MWFLIFLIPRIVRSVRRARQRARARDPYRHMFSQEDHDRARRAGVSAMERLATHSDFASQDSNRST